MSTLTEIEAAADSLPPEQKQELILFLAERLRLSGAPPPSPRSFSPGEITGWMEEDEADFRRFQQGV